MGGKFFVGFLTALFIALIALVTPFFTDLRNLVQSTFSPAGTLVAEINIATSTKTATLPVRVASTSVKSKVSASTSKKMSPPPAPVISVTPPLATSSQLLPSPVSSSLTTATVPADLPSSSLSPLSSSSSSLSSSTSPASSSSFSAQEMAVAGRILVSEIMVGADGNAKYEFVELYNPTGQAVDLTGYSVRKKSSSGAESSLVAASRFENKTILPGRYFLLASSGGYDGAVQADILWPASYSLAANNNAIVVYNNRGEKVEEIAWREIPAGSSLTRASWSGNQFNLTPHPTPQNSQSL